jgi:hypothetical protein
MALGRAVDPSTASRLFAKAPGAQLALVRAAWGSVVGHEIARRCEVVSLERRTLTVRVTDAGWQRVLHRMQRQILSRLADMAGGMAPTRLGFTVGAVATVSRQSPVATPPEAAAVAPPAEVVAAAQAIADADLREQFLRSAALYLQRKHHA